MNQNCDITRLSPTGVFGEAVWNTRTQDVLSRLAQRPSAMANPEFYRDCVRDLAAYYGARIVMISLFSDRMRSKMHSFLFWKDDAFQENIEYSLSGTPCQTVLDSRQQYIPEMVSAVYPQIDLLITHGIESYFGVPLGEPHSNGPGLICIMHDKPMRLSDQQQSVLRVFSSRIAGELVWQQRPEQLGRLDLEYEVSSLAKDLGVAYSELNGLYDVISHDLRAPLRTVYGFSEAVLEELDALEVTGNRDQIKDYCQRIHKASVHMDQQIESLAQLRRISNAPVLRTPLDLSHLAEDVAVNIRDSKRYAHEVNFEADPDIRVTGDRYLLKELMLQLLDNAWKFTLDCPNARVHLYREQQDGQEVYVVEDNGAGFDIRYSNKLFTLFHKLHHDPRHEGHGIGLALAHRVVRRHGGRIWAESTLGAGSRFCFTLPLE